MSAARPKRRGTSDAALDAHQAHDHAALRLFARCFERPEDAALIAGVENHLPASWAWMAEMDTSRFREAVTEYSVSHPDVLPLLSRVGSVEAGVPDSVKTSSIAEGVRRAHRDAVEAGVLELAAISGGLTDSLREELTATWADGEPAGDGITFIDMSGLHVLAAEPKDYVIEPCIERGMVGVLAGAGASRKSMLALTLGMSTALGANLPGMQDHFKIPRQQNTMILMGEDPQREVAARLHAIRDAWHGIFPYDLGTALNGRMFIKSLGAISLFSKPRDGVISLSTEAKALERAAIDRNIRLLVIDPVASHFGGIDENSNTDVGRTMALLTGMAERIGCAIILVHHIAKSSHRNGTVDMYQARGAGTFVEQSRFMFAMLKDPNEGNGEQVIRVKNLKASYSAGWKGDLLLSGADGSPALVMASPVVQERGAIHAAVVRFICGEDGKPGHGACTQVSLTRRGKSWLLDEIENVYGGKISGPQAQSAIDAAVLAGDLDREMKTAHADGSGPPCLWISPPKSPKTAISGGYDDEDEAPF